MKVILIKDVARLGRKSDVKEVPDGHAINFLIPRKLAIIATPEHIKRNDVDTQKKVEQKKNQEQAFLDTVSKLNGEVLSFSVSANPQGHLYKGIHVDDIVTLLTQKGYALTKEHIVLAHPIKEVGTYEIALTHGNLKGVCTLSIVAQ